MRRHPQHGRAVAVYSLEGYEYALQQAASTSGSWDPSTGEGVVYFARWPDVGRCIGAWYRSGPRPGQRYRDRRGRMVTAE